MNDVEKYLKKMSVGLYRLPESERDEILSEIKNHIHEAESIGEDKMNLSILNVTKKIRRDNGVIGF